jgi:hypothetical protein
MAWLPAEAGLAGSGWTGAGGWLTGLAGADWLSAGGWLATGTGAAALAGAWAAGAVWAG